MARKEDFIDKFLANLSSHFKHISCLTEIFAIKFSLFLFLDIIYDNIA